MATYKVIQDIEAEDKLIGPLSVVQFIFACITAGFLYLSYIVYAKHAAFLLGVFLPISAFSAFFAIPWGRDQPTEIWALAKLKFLIYPHKRVWSQSGVRNLVTITVPKKIAISYTNGLTQEEVQGRLKALAETIDTRGWATKNVSVNLSNPSTASAPIVQSDQRLSAGSMNTQAPEVEVRANDDVLDEKNNPTAYKFAQKIQESSNNHRQQIINSLQNNTQAPQLPQNNRWFVPGAANQPLQAIPSPVQSGYTPEQERYIAEDLRRKHDRRNAEYTSNLKVIKPISEQQNEQNLPQNAPVNNMTHAIDPAIINMANNSDLSVAAIQHEAHKQDQSNLDNEIIINLH